MKRSSRFLIPQSVWKFILSTIAGQIAGWLLRKLATSLRRVWSELGNEKFWPVGIFTLLLITFWLRMGTTPTTFWNIPPIPSPFPHLSLYAQALLENLIAVWTGSLALSILYCGRRHLERFWWGKGGGELSRSLMLVSLFFYPGLVAWFSLTAETSFLIPGWAQTPLWLASSYPLSTMIFRSIETVIGRRILGKGGLLTVVIDRSLGVASIGMRTMPAFLSTQP